MPPKDSKSIEIDLKKFKMQWIGDNKTIVIIGPRGRGKSTILKDYLFWHQDIPYCACICPTEPLNSAYANHIPSRFIFAKYSTDLLERFYTRQETLKTNKINAASGTADRRYADVDCRGLLIMDDCLADDKEWKHDGMIKKIFTNGRHADITFIITMQYQLGLTPLMRDNIDWVFICRQTKKIEKEKLWRYYAGIFPSFDMFNQIFNSCTKDKCCMVIDCLSESEKIEDQVFWYKADIHESFRVCYDEFWKDNQEYLNRRLQLSNPASTASTQVREQEDEYYKYVGRGSKVRYNVNMSQGNEEDEDDIVTVLDPPKYDWPRY
jgi:hypothetical protein